MQKRFLYIAIRKYDFVEKRAGKAREQKSGKARERKPEKRESGKKKNLSRMPAFFSFIEKGRQWVILVER